MLELDLNSFVEQWNQLHTEEELPKILSFIMDNEGISQLEKDNELLLNNKDFIKDLINGER